MPVSHESGIDRELKFAILFGVPNIVDTRDGSDDNHVWPSHNIGGTLEAQLIDFVVNVSGLFDVGVTCGDVGFGLIVVVVTNKVRNGVIREEFAHFLVELACQGFVVRDN